MLTIKKITALLLMLSINISVEPAEKKLSFEDQEVVRVIANIKKAGLKAPFDEHVLALKWATALGDKHFICVAKTHIAAMYNDAKS